MKRKRIILGFLAAALLLLIGGKALLTWSMESHGGNPARFETVAIGMTPQAVESILGTPWKTRTNDTHEAIWTYGNTFKWCAMQVRFDQSNRVESKWHDH